MTLADEEPYGAAEGALAEDGDYDDDEDGWRRRRVATRGARGPADTRGAGEAGGRAESSDGRLRGPTHVRFDSSICLPCGVLLAAEGVRQRGCDLEAEQREQRGRRTAPRGSDPGSGGAGHAGVLRDGSPDGLRRARRCESRPPPELCSWSWTLAAARPRRRGKAQPTVWCQRRRKALPQAAGANLLALRCGFAI